MKVPILIFLFVSSTILQAQDIEWEWIKSATGNVSARNVATDVAGNIYVAGEFSNDLIIDDMTILSWGDNTNLFLLKYDNDGNIIWGRTSEGDKLINAYNVTTDNDGNIYMTGHFFGNSITFDNITLINSWQSPYVDMGYADIYIVKFNSDGNVLWAKSYGGIAQENVWSMCVDNSGNVYILGTYHYDITIDNISLTNSGPGYHDYCLIKYDTNGNVIWAKNAIGEGQDDAWCVTTDSENNVYIAGAYMGASISFDNISLTNTSDNMDLFVAKYNTEGEIQWVKSGKGNYRDVAKTLTIDRDDNVYLSGYFDSDSLCFESETIYLSDNGNSDMFLLKFDKNGEIIWIKRSEGECTVEPSAIISYNNEYITVTGTFHDNNSNFNESFGLNSVYSNGSYDMFIVNYDSSGNDIWAESVGGQGMDFVQDVERDNSGNLYLAGFFSSNILNFGSITLINDFQNNMFIAKKNDIVSISEKDTLTSKISLSNYPNPFNLETTINYELPTKNHVNISVFNNKGELINTLINGIFEKGTHSVKFEGSKLNSGVYFYTLQTNNIKLTRKMVLIR